MYEAFQKKSQDAIAADADKRRSVTTASRIEWREVARQAEEARTEFERLRCAYIEHVVSCKACDWNALAYSYLSSLEPMGYAATSSHRLADIA